MIGRFTSILLAFCFVLSGTLYSQSLDSEIPKLANKISKALVAQGYKNVATVDFTDLQDQPTELGRLLSERLEVEIVSSGGVSMVDRANISNVLNELQLTESGLVNPANAKKLGRFAGVDVIVTGNVTELDSEVELLVKAIATETARVVAAGRIKFPLTPDFLRLHNIGVRSNELLVSPVGNNASDQSSYRDSRPIAAKDIGSLRVVLKSILGMRLTDPRGQSVGGIRCSFEFINRETRRAIFVALNAESEGRVARHSGISFGPSSPVPTLLRSSVLDSQGGRWNLETSNLIGVGFVLAGVYGPGGQQVYKPYEIVKLLRLRDELGRDTSDPADGAYTTDTRIGPAGYNTVFGRSNIPMNFVSFGNTFVSGSTTAIEQGKSASAVMDFRSLQEKNPAPASVQISMEIVVGVAGTDAKILYSLNNIIFDHVSLPAYGVK